MNCLAIDDEPLILELMEDNIRQIPFLQLVGSCKSALEAAEILLREKVDLIFLDIQMPKLSGLQFLKTLSNPPMVIIITAYDQFALEGFNLNVVDYLLKPVSFDRFLKACNKAFDLYNLNKHKAGSEKTEAKDFFVHVEYTLVKVVIADIDYVEGLKDYIKIYVSTASRPIITRMTMKSIEEKLPTDKFIRTHKSFIVAVEKVTTIKRDFIVVGDKEIPLSETYRESLYGRFGV